MERPDTLRNQQVMCSSHTTSSKKHRKLRFSMLFCCKNAENGVGQNVGQPPDPHFDPHRLAISGFAANCQLMPHGYVVHFSGSAGWEHPRIVGVFGVFLLQQLHGILRDGHLADGVAGFGAA